MSETSPSGTGVGAAETADTPSRAQIGWSRAIASGLSVIIVGFFGAVVGPNAILTRSLALTRGARELLATLLFFAVIAILAIALRGLQRRGFI